MKEMKNETSTKWMFESYVAPQCEVVVFQSEGVLCTSGLDMKGSTQDLYDDDVITLS